MTKEIDVNGKKITLTSNGLTPIVFKMLFKKDIIKQITGSDDGITVATDNAPELGFVMNMQALGVDPMKLTMAQFYEWLTQFEPLDLTVSAMDIINVYLSDSVPDEEPKKKA